MAEISTKNPTTSRIITKISPYFPYFLPSTDLLWS